MDRQRMVKVGLPRLGPGSSIVPPANGSWFNSRSSGDVRPQPGNKLL